MVKNFAAYASQWNGSITWVNNSGNELSPDLKYKQLSPAPRRSEFLRAQEIA